MNVLHKGLLMQDWVFRLGYIPFIRCRNDFMIFFCFKIDITSSCEKLKKMLVLMYVLRHILKDITDDIQTLLFVGNIILT